MHLSIFRFVDTNLNENQEKHESIGFFIAQIFIGSHF